MSLATPINTKHQPAEKMNSDEYRDTLKSLGLTQVGAAAFLGVNGVTVTKQEIADKIAQMQAKKSPRATNEPRQLSNGKWKHGMSPIEWNDKSGCAADFQFSQDWDRTTWHRD